MEDKTIIITTVTEKVKFSEMSDRDKKIWYDGYESGKEDKYNGRTISAILIISWLIYLGIIALS